jgi:hypothetical protein
VVELQLLDINQNVQIVQIHVLKAVL